MCIRDRVGVLGAFIAGRNAVVGAATGGLVDLSGAKSELDKFTKAANENAAALTAARASLAELGATDTKKAMEDAAKSAIDLEAAKQRMAEMTFDMATGHQ